MTWGPPDRGVTTEVVGGQEVVTVDVDALEATARAVDALTQAQLAVASCPPSLQSDTWASIGQGWAMVAQTLLVLSPPEEVAVDGTPAAILHEPPRSAPRPVVAPDGATPEQVVTATLQTRIQNARDVLQEAAQHGRRHPAIYKALEALEGR